jgi:hypothetical protein
VPGFVEAVADERQLRFGEGDRTLAVAVPNGAGKSGGGGSDLIET